MASYETNNDIVGGGLGFGGGGGLAMVLVILVVLWTLFRDGHKDGHDGGYRGYGDGCGPCVRPSFIDESNYEEERNINAKLCKVDDDVWKTACETQKEVHCEGEKTRDLVRCEAEKQWMYKLNEKDRIIQTLEGNSFAEKKFDQLAVLIGGLNGKIERLECEVPKRAPIYAETITPNTHHTDCDDRRFSKRGRCNDWDDGCCV